MPHNFWADYGRHRHYKNRGALPAERRIQHHKNGPLGEIRLEARHNPHANWFNAGYITYSIGGLDPMIAVAGANLAPFLASTPSLFQIYGFYSQHEHTMKGIGGALLNHAVKLADARGCPFIVVINSTNDEVYEAFGFRKADSLGTWYASTSFMKSRTRGYETPTTGSVLVP